MSEPPLFNHTDRVDDVEALLRDVTDDDFDLVEPPAEIWSGIESELVGERPAEVVPLRRRRPGVLLAAAAAAVAVVAGAAAFVNVVRDGDPVIASADLLYDADQFDPLGADASATAHLVERDDGFEIRIDDADLPTSLGEPADLELWMIAVEDDGSLDVQSVSLVDAEDPGTYPVPDGLDPDAYSIVDISIEPRDGDASHSSRSILRGTLNA